MKPHWKDYRKKPVVIQAIQYTEDSLQEILTVVGSKAKFQRTVGSSSDGEGNKEMYTRLAVHTLEGEMTVSIGDFVIKGVKGEFYPCKPDVFALTYEPAKEIIPEEIKRSERAAITQLISATREKLFNLEKQAKALD